MIYLEEDWLTTGVLDMEYKQYELLAYLQKVNRKFDDLKLYPYFSDIISHYDSMSELRFNKDEMFESFPKKLVGLDLANKRLKYENVYADDDYIKDFDALINFSLEQLKESITIGKSIYDEVERCVDILELGVIHYTSDKGFFIIVDESIDVYEYEMSTIFTLSGKKALRTRLIRSYPKGYHLSYEDIRLDLISSTKLINPSTFLVDCPIEYPLEETLLPITKRMLVKKLSQQRKS